MRILVVEDDAKIAQLLKRGLEAEGYAVEVAGDGEEALWASEGDPPDLVLLDILLPRRDGLSVCKEMRKRWPQLPILMLTARDGVSDRVCGLDSGADDYLVKPFAFAELLARVRALLRRGSQSRCPELRIADLVVNPATHEVVRAGRRISLTAREYSLLVYLLRNRDRVLTRTAIESHVWGYDYEGASNIVDVYIRHLRQKLDSPPAPRLLHTLRNVGYVLREE